MTQRTQVKLLFLISFGVFILAWYLLWAQDVLSFDFLKDWTVRQNVKLWESYVKQSSVDNAAVWTVLAQVSFGNGSYKVPPTTNNVYDLFAYSQILVNTNILDLLKTTDTPELALDTHIAHTSKTIEQIRDSTVSLNELANTYLTLSKECLLTKQGGDRMFFEWVATNNSQKSDDWLSISLENAPCYITNRIKANAYAYLSQKVQTHATILVKREQLLTQNKSILLENTEYFEWDILDRLVDVKAQLASVNSVSYDSFNSIFNFDYLNSDYTLPVFQKVLFEPWKIPNYTQPAFWMVFRRIFW